MRRLGDVMATEGSLQGLLAKARVLAGLQAALAERLGPDFSIHCKVAGLREDGTLVLVAGSAAWATRFRYLGPDLVNWAKEAQIPALRGLRAVHVIIGRGGLPGDTPRVDTQ
jgi:hypothetical protein